jgi:hypothetical protein
MMTKVWLTGKSYSSSDVQAKPLHKPCIDETGHKIDATTTNIHIQSFLIIYTTISLMGLGS